MINEIAEGDRRKVYLETWDLQINFASIALIRIKSHFHIFDKNELGRKIDIKFGWMAHRVLSVGHVRLLQTKSLSYQIKYIGIIIYNDKIISVK